jgi:hypothetical protein
MREQLCMQGSRVSACVSDRVLLLDCYLCTRRQKFAAGCHLCVKFMPTMQAAGPEASEIMLVFLDHHCSFKVLLYTCTGCEQVLDPLLGFDVQ